MSDSENDDTDYDDKTDNEDESENEEESDDGSIGEDDFTIDDFKKAWLQFTRKTREKYIGKGEHLSKFLSLLRDDIAISIRQCDTFVLMMKNKLGKEKDAKRDPDKIDVNLLFEFVNNALDVYEQENQDRTLEFAIGDAASKFNDSEDGKAHRRQESLLDMQHAQQLSARNIFKQSAPTAMNALGKASAKPSALAAAASAATSGVSASNAAAVAAMNSMLSVPNEAEASKSNESKSNENSNNNNSSNNNNNSNNKSGSKSSKNGNNKVSSPGGGPPKGKSSKSSKSSNKGNASPETPEYAGGSPLQLVDVSSTVVHNSVGDDDDDEEPNPSSKRSIASSKGTSVTPKERAEKTVRIEPIIEISTEDVNDHIARQESMLYRVYARVSQLDQQVKGAYENDDAIMDGLHSLKYLKTSSIAALQGELSHLKHDLYNIFESTSISSAQQVSSDISKKLNKMDSKLGNTVRELRDEDYATQDVKLRCYEKLDRLLGSIDIILGKYKSSVNRPIVVKKVILGEKKSNGDADDDDDRVMRGYDTENNSDMDPKSGNVTDADVTDADTTDDSDDSDNSDNSESTKQKKRSRRASRRQSVKKTAKEELFESIFGSQYAKLGINPNTAMIFTMKPFISEIDRVKKYLGSIDFYMNGTFFDKLSRLENILQRMYDYGTKDLLIKKAFDNGHDDRFASKEEIEAKLKIEKQKAGKQKITVEEMQKQLAIQRLDYEQQLRSKKEQISSLQQTLEAQKKLTAKSEELIRNEKDRVQEMQTINELNAAKVNELKFELRRNYGGMGGMGGMGGFAGGMGSMSNQMGGGSNRMGGRLGQLARLADPNAGAAMSGNLSSGGLQTATGSELARRRSERHLLGNGYNAGQSSAPASVVGGNSGRRNSLTSSLGTVTTVRTATRSFGRNRSVSPRTAAVNQGPGQRSYFNYLDYAGGVNGMMNDQVTNEYSNKLSTLMSDFKHRAKLIQQAKWNDYEIYLRDKFGEYSMSDDEKKLKYLDISTAELPSFFAQRMKSKNESMVDEFVKSTKINASETKRVLDAENVLGFGWYELFFLYRENTALNAKLNALEFENDCLNDQLTIRHLNEESWIFEKELNKLKLEKSKIEKEKKLIDKYRLDMYRDMKRTEQELHTSLRYEQFQFDRQRKKTQALLDSERDGILKDREELEDMREDLETKERLLDERMKQTELIKKEFEIKVNLTGDDEIEAIATAKFEKHLSDHNELLEKRLRSQIESEILDNEQQSMNIWEQRWDKLKQERSRPLEKNEIALKEQMEMLEQEKKTSESLRDEVKSLKEEILKYTSQVSELKGEMSVLDAENGRLKAKVERMEGFMLSSIEDAEIEKQFEDYESTIADYRAKVEVYQKDTQKYLLQYEELNKKNMTLKNENGKLMSIINDQKRKLNDPSYLNEKNFKNFLTKQQRRLISTLEKSEKNFNDIGAKYGQFKEKFRELHELMKTTEKSSKKLYYQSKDVNKLSRDYYNDLDSWYIHKNHVLRAFFTSMEQNWWEKFKTHELYHEISTFNEKVAEQMRIVLQDSWFECKVTNHTLIRWFARFNDYYSEKRVFFEDETSKGNSSSEQVYYWTINLRKIIDDMRPAVIEQYYRKQWQKRMNDKRFVLSENAKLKQIYYTRQKQYMERIEKEYGEQGEKYRKYLIRKFEKDANNQVRYENKQSYDDINNSDDGGDDANDSNDDYGSESGSYSGSETPSESGSNGSQSPNENDGKLDKVSLFSKLAQVANERENQGKADAKGGAASGAAGEKSSGKGDAKK